jgi:hypothetical protein
LAVARRHALSIAVPGERRQSVCDRQVAELDEPATPEGSLAVVNSVQVHRSARIVEKEHIGAWARGDVRRVEAAVKMRERLASVQRPR